MRTIRITLKAKDEALRRMATGWRKALSESLKDWSDAILAESQKRVPAGATTGLKLSGHRDPGEPVSWAIVEYSAPYAAYVHEGTRPHWPPPGALLRWVELVLGVRGKKAKEAEFLVARHISRFGTKPQPFLRDAANVVQPHVEAIFRKHMEKAFKDLERVVGPHTKR